MLQEILVALIFGFGLSSISLGLAVFGVLKDKYWLVLIGAVLFTPFSYYIFGASSANAFALLPLLFLVLAAAAVREKNRLWAWIMVAPSFLLVLWVFGVAVIYGLR
jgi:hypothetical protein